VPHVEEARALAKVGSWSNVVGGPSEAQVHVARGRGEWSVLSWKEGGRNPRRATKEAARWFIDPRSRERGTCGCRG